MLQSIQLWLATLQNGASILMCLGVRRCLKKVQLRAGFSGTYGSWTDKGIAAKAMMTSAEYTPTDLPKPWVCSCFTSKAYACVIEDFRKRKLNEKSVVLFWDTKSAVQPVSQVLPASSDSTNGGIGSSKDEVTKEPLSFEHIEKQVMAKEKKWLKKCGCGDQQALEKMLEATVPPNAEQMAKLARSAL
jgi:hypothetical protein